jgi:hypothetical protein
MSRLREARDGIIRGATRATRRSNQLRCFPRLRALATRSIACEKLRGKARCAVPSDENGEWQRSRIRFSPEGHARRIGIGRLKRKQHARVRVCFHQHSSERASTTMFVTFCLRKFPDDVRRNQASRWLEIVRLTELIGRPHAILREVVRRVPIFPQWAIVSLRFRVLTSST